VATVRAHALVHHHEPSARYSARRIVHHVARANASFVKAPRCASTEDGPFELGITADRMTIPAHGCTDRPARRCTLRLRRLQRVIRHEPLAIRLPGVKGQCPGPRDEIGIPSARGAYVQQGIGSMRALPDAPAPIARGRRAWAHLEAPDRRAGPHAQPHLICAAPKVERCVRAARERKDVRHAEVHVVEGIGCVRWAQNGAALQGTLDARPGEPVV
jgi:hypothetical protein